MSQRLSLIRDVPTNAPFPDISPPDEEDGTIREAGVGSPKSTQLAGLASKSNRPLDVILMGTRPSDRDTAIRHSKVTRYRSLPAHGPTLGRLGASPAAEDAHLQHALDGLDGAGQVLDLPGPAFAAAATVVRGGFEV